jgi:hypothetical protein
LSVGALKEALNFAEEGGCHGSLGDVEVSGVVEMQQRV